LLQELKPDLVFHLAGHNGGIAFNLAHPADIFHHNSLMALNLLDACARAGTRRVVSTVASCAYGDEGAAVLSPQRFLHGLPHETVACHGFAKRSLYLASQFYRQQYGLDAICVCPTTLYGPGDSYDPLRTKVVGAMVKRFVDAAEAGLDEVVCWGTGRPLRELLYVADCVDMLVNVAMADDVDGSLPINLGSGQETSLADLAGLVADRAGYTGRVRWDEFRPDGQMRKALDTQGRDWLGRGSTPLVSGIDMTIADYIERKRKGHL
jgi:GDP-L-fucose synthase